MRAWLFGRCNGSHTHDARRAKPRSSAETERERTRSGRRWRWSPHRSKFEKRGRPGPRCFGWQEMLHQMRRSVSFAASQASLFLASCNIARPARAAVSPGSCRSSRIFPLADLDPFSGSSHARIVLMRECLALARLSPVLHVSMFVSPSTRGQGKGREKRQS